MVKQRKERNGMTGPIRAQQQYAGGDVGISLEVDLISGIGRSSGGCKPVVVRGPEGRPLSLQANKETVSLVSPVSPVSPLLCRRTDR
ncbi:unnamed protein product [Arctogadus glacialis]